MDIQVRTLEEIVEYNDFFWLYFLNKALKI